MTVRISKIPNDPYLGYDARHIARVEAARICDDITDANN